MGALVRDKFFFHVYLSVFFNVMAAANMATFYTSLRVFVCDCIMSERA